MPLDCSGSPQQPCLGHLDLAAVALEQLDGLLRRVGLVLVGAAAVEVGDALAPAGGRRACLRAQRWNVRPANFGQRGVAVDARRSFSASAPQRPVAQRPVGDRRDRRAERGRARSGARDQPVAQREAGRASRSSRARLRVDLGDVDALRADLRADAAARAVVERGVGATLLAGTRKRSACGPTYFGPGNSGVTFETGQYVSQIVHLTQWSSESRISSPQDVVARDRIALSCSAAADRRAPSPRISPAAR